MTTSRPWGWGTTGHITNAGRKAGMIWWAHTLPLGSSGLPRVGEGRFLSRNCGHCSGKQPPQLLELVLLLN